MRIGSPEKRIKVSQQIHELESLASIPPDIIYFAAIWVVSAFVLYLSTRLFGAKGGFIESLAASLLGAVVYTLFKGSLLFQIAALLLWLLI